jgi:hypothetical protein
VVSDVVVVGFFAFCLRSRLQQRVATATAEQTETMLDGDGLPFLFGFLLFLT